LATFVNKHNHMTSAMSTLYDDRCHISKAKKQKSN
jgi:hypothetical protein